MLISILAHAVCTAPKHANVTLRPGDRSMGDEMRRGGDARLRLTTCLQILGQTFPQRGTKGLEEHFPPLSQGHMVVTLTLTC